MITVLFQTESHFPVDAQAIKDAMSRNLLTRVTGETEVSISIVGDRAMTRLNMLYRKLGNTTDVLSFPQNDPSQSMAPFVPPPDGVMRLGDIVISYPQAVVEAGEENMLVLDKIIELALHGLEHLFGNHHEE
ncbi:MAG: rRNA maturation RNase YbeY [Patescibacteria group bacterium]